MCKQFIKKTLINLTLLSASLSFNAFAENTDIHQEVLLDSDRQHVDLKTKTSIYIDNVMISQGSLVIRADLAQVKVTDDNKTYFLKGSPATFQQILSDASTIKLAADEIIYDPSQNTITISGHAKLSQEGSEVHAHQIIYNLKTEQLDAKGTAEEPVKTILQPQKLSVDDDA